MKKRNLLILAGSICLLLIVAVLPLMTACPKTTPPEAKTLKLGMIAALTGPYSSSELFQYGGAQLATEWMNEKGGITIDGQKYLIECVVEDQKAGADTAIAAATKLIESHKVKFIYGGIVPFQTLAVKTVTEPAGVLHIVAYNSGLPEDMGPDTPYTFRTGGGLLDFIPQLCQYLVEAYPNVKTVAMIAPEDPSNGIALDTMKTAAEGVGLTILGMETFPQATTVDFFPVVTKALALKPDAINVYGLSPWLASVLKAARELGFTGPIFSQSMGDVLQVRDIAGKDAATDFYSTGILPDNPDNPPMFMEIQTMWTEKGYESKYGRFSTADVPGGFDGFWCTTQAIEAAQSLDPTEVAKTWEQMESLQTTKGTAKMGGLKTAGINHIVVMPFAITRLMNGEAEHVKWLVPEIP
jgi:branched-chain amino acid transport system substrate-binding protein